MSLEFLSDEWFAKVKEIREGAGDVETPAALADWSSTSPSMLTAATKKWLWWAA